MRKGRVAAALLACGVLALWVASLLRANALFNAYAGVSLRVEGAGVPHQTLVRALQSGTDAGVRLTAAWTRSQKTRAFAETMQTSCTLRVIAVCGDMREISPMRLLAGSYPTESDAQGCLVDAESAMELFHSAQTVGTTLTVNQKTYTVRGVVKGLEPMLLVRDEAAAYENFEFAADDPAMAKAEAEAFLGAVLEEGDCTAVQNGLYARILRGLMWLPVTLLPFALAIVGLICGKAEKTKRWHRAAAYALAATCAAIGVCALGKTIYLPQTFLPTRCADLAFWGMLTDGWREAWRQICLITPLPKDVYFFREMRYGLCSLCVVSAGSALLLTWLVRACIRRRARAR